MKTLRAYDLELTTKLGDHPQTADHAADLANLIVVIMFSLIGLLIAANLILSFPDPALTVEQFNIFAGP
jgi:hypothetical protein